MSLFRKSISPAALGTVIYDFVHRAFLDGPMSHESLAEELNEDPADLPDGYEGEVLMALLYSAMVAVEATCEESTGGPILESMVKVYVSQGEEGGLGRSQVEQLKEQLRRRVHEYAACLRNHTGSGPAWHLGKAFYCNVVGEKRESAVGVTTAARYFFASVDGVKGVLRQFKVTG